MLRDPLTFNSKRALAILISSRDRTVCRQRRTLRLMGATENASKSIKVLMLHGYTQNGPLFRAKTRVLEKHLLKAFSSVSFTYPTGPLQLQATDVPGFDSTSAADPADVEAYGWWRRSDTSNPPEYSGLDRGLETIAKVLESEGPFDGVIGFSQGAALAAMVASLLEGKSRRQSFANARTKSSLAIPYPSSFESLSHPPLKFCVPYSGFIAPGERYSAFYETPVIQTQTCHFIGSLDTVVEEKRTQMLVDACGGSDKTQVVIHPGGHFVPTGKQFLDMLVAFIRKAVTTDKAKTVVEERVEDMEVPF
jgi:predicted esterase